MSKLRLFFPVILLLLSLVGYDIQKQANPPVSSPVSEVTVPVLAVGPEGALVGTWHIEQCSITFDPNTVLSVTEHPAEIIWDGRQTVISTAINHTSVKSGWFLHQRAKASYSPPQNPDLEVSIHENRLIIAEHRTKTEHAYPLPEEILEPPGPKVLWATGTPEETRVLIHYFKAVPTPDRGVMSTSGLLLGTIRNEHISWDKLDLNEEAVNWQLPQVVAQGDKVYIGGVEDVILLNVQQKVVSAEKTVTGSIRELIPPEKDVRVAGPSLGYWNDILIAGMRVGDQYCVKAIYQGLEIGTMAWQQDRIVLANASGRSKEQPTPKTYSILAFPQSRTSW